MTPGEAIYATLSTKPGVTDIVDARIYPGRAPQDAARPHVIYQQIGSSNDPAHGMQDGIRTDLWQVTSTSVVSMAAACTLAAAVRTALHAFTPTAGTGASPFILEDELENVDEPDDGSEVPKYQVVATFTIIHRGAV